MSWEVRSMKSKTSLFSPGLSRNILSRFWPLWLFYLGLLLVQLPVTVSGYLAQGINVRYTMDRILQLSVDVAGYAMIASVLSVMAAFSYLYSKRGCSIINSLPIRRETAFVTACLTGLLPLLLAELLTWLVALGVFAGSETALPEYLNSWLLAAVLSTVASYGFALFCAMLTGHILVLPALFLVLNTAVYVLESLVQTLLNTLVYGYEGGTSISRLSPLPYAGKALRVIADPASGSLEPEYILLGMDSLAVYAVAGVLFIVPALLLCRRRKMERAGDVVAIKALEPVFKYCASVYAALGLGALLAETMDNALGSGLLGSAVLALTLVLGAALGYYAAEMLLQKSLRVFRSRMRGLLIVWAVLLLGVAVIEFDLTGYEKRVPETDDIESVLIINDGRVTDDAESIELTRKIHQTAIDNREHNRQANNQGVIHIGYNLKDGSSIERTYYVDRSREWIDSVNSEFALCRELYMLPQNKELMMGTAREAKAENIVFCEVQQLLDMSDEFTLNFEQLRLSPQQAEELYTQCILPDTKDSMLGTRWFYMDEKAYETRSDTSLYIHVESGEGAEYGPYVFSVDITLDAERTIAWLEDNLGIEVRSYLEVRPEVLEDLEYY